MTKNKYLIIPFSVCIVVNIYAADLPLVHSELEVSVPPNVFMSVDNSGSMLAEYAMTVAWARKPYITYDSKKTATSAEDPMFDWRSYSSDFNTLMYNPEKTYKPWPGYPDADYAALRDHPDPQSSYYNTITDLNKATYDHIETGFQYALWKDSAGYKGSGPSPDGFVKKRNNQIDLWDNYSLIRIDGDKFEISQYTFNPSKSKMSKKNISKCDFDYENYQYWFNYYKKIGDITNRDLFASYLKGSKNGFVECLGRKLKSKKTVGKFFGRTIDQEKQNIANWFQYHRSRQLAVNSLIGELVEKFPTFYYGLLNFPITQYNAFVVPVRKPFEDAKAHNDSMLARLFKYGFGHGHTPLAETLIYVGEYFKGNNPKYDPPSILSCQQNYHFLLTDGGRNEPDVINPTISDFDGDGYIDYPGSVSMADIASYYFNNDLAPAVKNSVPTAGNLCASDVKPVDHQHLATIALSYGAAPKQTMDAVQC